MIFEDGYRSLWIVRKVNEDTWADSDAVSGIDSISISRSCMDSYPLLETGTLTLTKGIRESFETGYYRIEMLASQNGYGDELVSVATLLLEHSSGHVDKGYDAASITGYSVLKPLADRMVQVGTYAPKGSNGAEYAASLIRQHGKCPVVVNGSFTLNNHVVFHNGQSYLECVWNVLDAAGWCMRIDGTGKVTISEKPAEPALKITPTNGLRKLVPGIDYERGLDDVPNAYIVVYGDKVIEVVNDDPSSPVSTVAKKRRIDYVDTSPTPINGESMHQYAKRRLKEMSKIVMQYKYDREFEIGAVPFDLVQASIPEYGMMGSLRILSQGLTLDKGITVSETVGLEMEGYAA